MARFVLLAGIGSAAVALGNAAHVCAGEGKECHCIGDIYYAKKFASGKPGSGDTLKFADVKNDTNTKKLAGQSGSVTCNSKTIGGDGFVGYHKQCFCDRINPVVPYVCADEGSTCNCQGTMYYGKKFASGKPGKGDVNTFEAAKVDAASLTHEASSGSATCNSKTMGGDDPFPGYYKQCYCDPSLLAMASSEVPPAPAPVSTGSASLSTSTLKIGDLAQGSEFSKCIKIIDFNTKSLSDDVEVTDKVDGCCPEGYIPGIQHYNNYWGAMVVCGFKDDGSVSMSTSSSNSVKSCTYNKCYVVKMDVVCKDSSKMTLDGCCPKDQWDDNCKMYSKSKSFFGEKVEYCLSYAKKYKLEGTSEKTDDVVDGALSLTNLKAYTECAGAFGGGTYTLVGDAACVDSAGSHGAGELNFAKSTDKGDACAAACTADATCTGYDNRAAGCIYYKIAIAGSNKASTTYQCYKKVAAAPSPSPAPATAPAPAGDQASASAPASAPVSAGGSGKGPVVGGKELTCDDETYVKPTVDSLAASTFKNYQSCNEDTQKYTLDTSGFKTELQAGKNGNSNKYGLGMMCVDGNMYYIYTVDTQQATFDALKASPPDESGVLLKCLIKEGSAGGAVSPSTSNAVRTAGGAFAFLGACMMA